MSGGVPEDPDFPDTATTEIPVIALGIRSDAPGRHAAQPSQPSQPTGDSQPAEPDDQPAEPDEPAEPDQPGQPDQPGGSGDSQRAILSNSAVMAAGTLVSRASGFLRSTLLAAALGLGLHADIFNIANTVPNMLYILLAGGLFNAVLVPQLVRSMKADADGGAAYIDRVMTLAVLFLGTVTILLVAAAPLVMSVLLNADYSDPSMAEERQSAIDFARYCLPQVFFYGMFVLVGQILNARGRFGPMMWAPIANNVIAVSVLVVYLAVFGAATAAEQEGPFTPGQEALLGIGSTVGIAVQFLILVPYLRAAGVRFRPRFDFRGAGLGHTLRLGVWTLLFVIVNQLAYVVVVRLGSGGTAASADGTGITVYSNTMLAVMVPHSVVTVSLATAILPRLSASAADLDLAGLGRTLGSTLRTALVVIVPFAALLPAIALPLAHVLWGHGAGADGYEVFAVPMMLFGVGICVFTVHYLVLRAYYALERNRTVFFIQCAIAATNIGAAIALVHAVEPAGTASALIVAYTLAYAVGAIVSSAILVRMIRPVDGPPLPWRATAVRFVARLGPSAALVAAVSLTLRVIVGDTLDELFGDLGPLGSAVEVAAIGLGTVAVFLTTAPMFRLREVTAVTDTVFGRLRRRRS